jgi:ABC-2 type transport system ATP-binding protein
VAAPDSGQIRVFGRDPANGVERTEIRRRLGYLPQDPGFQRGFSVFEFVDYVAILKELSNRQERHDEVRRVIESVDLTSVSGKRVRALSGGMKRRTALAAALIGDPQFLVLDEPTAGLDPEQRLRFRELVGHAGEGRAVLLSTHQTEDVAALCQDVVVLDRGKVLFHGTPAELTGVAADRVWFADERHPGAELAWRTGDGRVRHLGSPPAGADIVEPTLEDGYLLLVGRFEEDVAA